jgi:hypothetical protein
MTDASARLIETLQQTGRSNEELDFYLNSILSRDENEFMTAAQWMVNFNID